MFYLILFALSFTLTYLIKNYATKKSMLADVNERSSHTIPTPHGGGLAIAVAWFLGLTYLFFSSSINSTLYYALMMGLIITIVSFFDDLYELSARVRLIVQSLVAFIALYILGGLDEISLGLFAIDSPLVSNFIAFLMIVWFINLTNFIDGINGYAGSEFLFLGIAAFFIFGGSWFIILGAAVFGFLLWNAGNAKIFMGDSGSTLLGFSVAVFTIYYANLEASNLWVWIALFSLFWMDATYTLILRFINKERLSTPHRKHIYQRLVRSGFTHNSMVLVGLLYNLSVFIMLQISLLVGFIWMFIAFFALAFFAQKRLAFRDA